ncbi:MFS transporter [Spiractinospora alimapuensis]|uniref:MFS transporter n=1 Tax=Spiractinospora alimapuensis TaxID=2820884 RepID=UPI001F29A599|nr:MFS transporter [Spiractinospora alimapuensis]QVQ50741.1 MFS transporter [Spiractinospora alimapuensis]
MGRGDVGPDRVPMTAPLRGGPFRALVAGRTLMYVGNGLATVALAFAVLDVTGSVAQLGLVVGTRTLANILLVLFGGVLADRFSRALILRGGCALAAATQLVLGGALLLDIATLPLMFVLAALNGAAGAVNVPAAAALVPQLVAADQLRQANSIIRVGLETGRVTGMSVGTLLVAVIGPGWAITVDGLAFAAAGVCFVLLRLPPTEAKPTGEDSGNPLRELVAGWSEFVSRRWVWLVIFQVMLANVVWSGTVTVLGPAVADETFGRAVWGAMLTVNSVGLLVGGLWAARWQPRRALRFGVALTMIEAIPVVLLGLSPGLVPLFLFMFLSGVGIQHFLVAWEVSVQQNIPPDRLARVYSYDVLGSFLALPVGQMTIGPLATHFGATNVLIGGGCVIVLAACMALTDRGVRTLARR